MQASNLHLKRETLPTHHRTKQSFKDKRVPKLELGNEERLGTRTKNECAAIYLGDAN